MKQTIEREYDERISWIENLITDVFWYAEKNSKVYGKKVCMDSGKFDIRKVKLSEIRNFPKILGPVDERVECQKEYVKTENYKKIMKAIESNEKLSEESLRLKFILEKLFLMSDDINNNCEDFLVVKSNKTDDFINKCKDDFIKLKTDEIIKIRDFGLDTYNIYYMLEGYSYIGVCVSKDSCLGDIVNEVNSLYNEFQDKLKFCAF